MKCCKSQKEMTSTQITSPRLTTIETLPIHRLTCLFSPIITHKKAQPTRKKNPVKQYLPSRSCELILTAVKWFIFVHFQIQQKMLPRLAGTCYQARPR